ncbi:hypothetical protein JCM14076_04530 [Methylosoma difficile]
MFRKVRFGDCLKQALNYVKYSPGVWLGYCAVVGALLIVGHISLALGVFSAVTSLFVGVGIAKYIDMKRNDENPVGLMWAIKKSLPLAVLAGALIVLCWFAFMAIANLLKGEYYRILQFFFNIELTSAHLQSFFFTETAAWMYAYANIALIFALLMVSTFVGWFTHPLMLFQGLNFSEAKAQNDEVMPKNAGAIYKLMGFVFVEALLCSEITPLLTPALYMVTSTLIYVSYKSLFEVKKRKD